MLIDYFLLALRNLRKRGIRSWLTMLGIFIGIAAVVSLISLGQGLQTAIAGQFGANLATDILTVSSAETGFGPPGATAVRKLNENDHDLIESIKGVKSVIPRLIRISTTEFNGKTSFTYIGSMPEEQEDIDVIYRSLSIEASQGKLLSASDRGKVILGDDFLSQDLFGKKPKVGDKIKISGEEFEIAGFMERTSTFTINSVVLMPEEDMKKVLKIGDEIDLIVVIVEDEDRITQVAEEIERKMRKDRNQDEGEEDFAVQTPAQSLESVNTILSVVNIVVAGIAGISLLVGGVGIANTMFTSVLERRKEIGVMKSIGAQNKDILSIFIIESALLGLVGGLVGAAIGLTLAITAASAANSALGNQIFTVSPSYPLLLGSIAFSLIIGVVSGLVPAYQASRLNPVEALRQ